VLSQVIGTTVTAAIIFVADKMIDQICLLMTTFIFFDINPRILQKMILRKFRNKGFVNRKESRKKREIFVLVFTSLRSYKLFDHLLNAL